MALEAYALVAILIGLVLGLIGHLIPEGPHVTDKIKPKDNKTLSAQDRWEGLQPK